MAHYDMVIRDLESPPGTPTYVFISMDDPFIGANTWSLMTANNWIGTGSGTYSKFGFGVGVYFQDDAGSTRIECPGLNYPDDLQPGGPIKTGTGTYTSTIRPGFPFRLEWSTRNIVPDPLASGCTSTEGRKKRTDENG